MHENAEGFPVSRCAPCGRDVLLHVVLEPDDRERIRCVGCDAEIDPREVRWVMAPELERLGYDLQGDQAAGCGRPGCGQGRCGRD